LVFAKSTYGIGRLQAATSSSKASIQSIEAALREDAVGGDDDGTGGNVPGDDGVCADSGAAADANAAQNFCAGSNIDPVFNLRRGAADATGAKRDLVANNDVIADASAGMDDNAEGVWEKDSLGEGHANLTIQKVHEEPTDKGQPAPGEKDEKPSGAAVADGAILWMAPWGHVLKVTVVTTVT
jgi:hypothetical protein